MADFSKILQRGKRREEIKSHKGNWGVCESCGLRQKLFPYNDQQKNIWKICEECIEGLVAVEGDEP